MTALFWRWLFEVVRIQPPTLSRLIICLQNLIIDIKVVLFLEMVEYHTSEETSGSSPNDTHFENLLFRDLLIMMQSTRDRCQLVSVPRIRLKPCQVQARNRSCKRIPH